jgi:salicylate hydroxylase
MNRHIHRAGLHRGLLECAEVLECKAFLNSRLVSIDPSTPSLEVKGGKVCTGDLIVASDGMAACQSVPAN